MRKLILAAAISAIICCQVAVAADVGFDVNVNIGNRPRVVVPAPPVAVGVPVVIEEPPEFIYPPELGFYVAVGVPYDLYFSGNLYWAYRGNTWYRAPHYNGPWNVVRYKSIPPGLRKHRLERVRVIRDREYRVYEVERDRYRGKHFRPEKEWKDRQKEERKRWKEEEKWEKHERKHRDKHGRYDD